MHLHEIATLMQLHLVRYTVSSHTGLVGPDLNFLGQLEFGQELQAECGTGSLN